MGCYRPGNSEPEVTKAKHEVTKTAGELESVASSVLDVVPFVFTLPDDFPLSLHNMQLHFAI